MKGFTDKMKYAQDVWEAEDQRIQKETKAMESLRKAMHIEGDPIPANAKDNVLIVDKHQNDAMYKNSVMQIMMSS